jgi:effector-binding domain-containing protein
MEPTLETRPEQPYASIPVKATFREWGEVNALVPELFAWLGDTPPAGAPFYRYHVIGGHEDQFDLEVGLPLTSPTRGTARIRPGSKPAGTYAVLVHEGHPDTIANTHLALVKWAADNDIELAKKDNTWEALFESYLTNPEEESDLNNWRTELAYLTRT